MDTKAPSPAMSVPLATTLEKTTSSNVENNKFTNSGRDTTYNVQKNYNVTIEVFHDIISFFQFAAQLFVALVGMNQSTGADGEECDEVDVCGIVPQDPSSLPVANIADRYTRSMLSCMVGYPLYEPHPFSHPSKAEYSRNGISVGDVGFVTEAGDFEFLFNICPPQIGLPVVNPPNLPDGFSLEKLEDAETRPIRPLLPGTYFSSPTVRKTESGEYICEGPEGAILELPEGDIEGVAINTGRFKELAKCYGVKWYEYTKALGRGISHKSLYLVTSFTKCTQWGMVVFDRPGYPGEALTFVSSPLKWKGSGASFTRVSDGDTQNQCVLLRGYKIMIRQDIFDNLPTRQRATRIRGGGGTGFMSKLFRTRTKTTVTQSDAVELHADFNSSPIHPSDLINAELLNQNPDAKVALTHDDVWCDLLRDNFPEFNPATLINIARSYRNTVDEYGCVSLEKISKSGNKSRPVRLGGTEIPVLQESIQDARVECNPDVPIPAQISTTLRPHSVYHSLGDGDEGNQGISVPQKALSTISSLHPLRGRDARSRETKDSKRSVSVALVTDSSTELQFVDSGDSVMQKGEAPSMSVITNTSNFSEISVNSAINQSSPRQGPDISIPPSNTPNDLPITPPLSPEPSIFNFQFSDSNSNTDAPAHAVQGNLNTSQSNEARVMILCFDVVGNKFGANSNIFRFVRALAKDDHKKQIVYYQRGIKCTFITHTPNIIASAIDAAFPLCLDEHVKKGYQFIVRNYQPGDKICVFGFSRGAYIARAVAGMVYKVGILPRENIQLVDFAFRIYKSTGYDGYKLSQEFKRTFTPALVSNISVEFVGVWDTVSSVGIIPREHPYISLNYAVKKFRHALSLDEHQARFRPKVWNEITLSREHELDVDIPVPDVGNIAHAEELNRDDFVYVPPDRDLADVKEVWFAGTHTDVGGSSHPSPRSASLSSIPLRWMIKECILNETGIIFNLEYLRDDLNFGFDDLLKEIGETGKENCIKQYKELEACRDNQLKEMDRNAVVIVNSTTYTEDGSQHGLQYQRLSRHSLNIFDRIFDQLGILWYSWWLFEIIPMLYTYQDYHGNWVKRRMCNFGRGRYLPVYKNKVLVHSSVKERIESCGGKKQEKRSGLFNVLKDRFSDQEEYTPRAYNWNFLQQQGMIEYVD